MMMRSSSMGLDPGAPRGAANLQFYSPPDPRSKPPDVLPDKGAYGKSGRPHNAPTALMVEWVERRPHATTRPSRPSPGRRRAALSVPPAGGQRHATTTGHGAARDLRDDRLLRDQPGRG